MPEAVIVDAIRTPIGRAAKGSLKDVRTDDLAAVPLTALVERNPGVDFGETDDIMMGCGFQVGEAGDNVGRNASCCRGSTITCRRRPSTASAPPRCRRSGWRSTRSRPARATSTSRRASRPCRASPPRSRGNPTRGSTAPSGAPYDVYIPMGKTAENVAQRCKVCREAQDEWADVSQDRAVAARDGGHFDAEIVPVSDATARGARDDGPRPGTTMEKLAELKPVFRPESGTVTAGNACPLNDGAAAVLVMSDATARLGVKPNARIIASSVAAIRPEIMGLGPIPAVGACSSRPG